MGRLPHCPCGFMSVAVWGHPGSLLNGLSTTYLLSQAYERKGKIVCPKRIASWNKKVWTPVPIIFPSQGWVSLQFSGDALGSQAPYHLDTTGNTWLPLRRLFGPGRARGCLPFCAPGSPGAGPATNDVLGACRCLGIPRAEVFCKYQVSGGHGVQKIGR